MNETILPVDYEVGPLTGRILPKSRFLFDWGSALALADGSAKRPRTALPGRLCTKHVCCPLQA